MADSSNVAPALKLEWTVDLDTVIGAEVEYTEDGPVYSGGIKLGELVAERLADKLIEQADKLVREAAGYIKVSTIVNERIDAVVEAKLATLLDREIVPTDHFGGATGEPTTLATQIEQRAITWFGKRAGDGTSGTRQTNLEALVARVLDRKTTNELQAAVQQAMAEAKDQVQAVIGQDAGRRGRQGRPKDLTMAGASGTARWCLYCEAWGDHHTDRHPGLTSITCPRCQMTSYFPGDIRHGYCGNCHDYTSATCAVASMPNADKAADRRDEAEQRLVEFLSDWLTDAAVEWWPDLRPVARDIIVKIGPLLASDPDA